MIEIREHVARSLPSCKMHRQRGGFILSKTREKYITDYQECQKNEEIVRRKSCTRSEEVVLDQT